MFEFHWMTGASYCGGASRRDEIRNDVVDAGGQERGHLIVRVGPGRQGGDDPVLSPVVPAPIKAVVDPGLYGLRSVHAVHPPIQSVVVPGHDAPEDVWDAELPQDKALLLCRGDLQR